MYDCVLYLMRISVFQDQMSRYENGLELRNHCLTWIMDLQESDIELFHKFKSNYESQYEVYSQAYQGDELREQFIIGCRTLEDHVFYMMENQGEYCRPIDILMVSTMLNIDINVFSNENNHIRFYNTICPCNNSGNIKDNFSVSIYLQDAHYNPMIEMKRREPIQFEALTQEEEYTIENQFLKSQENPNAIVVKSRSTGDRLSQQSYDRLTPGEWLNDEIIHFFFVLKPNETGAGYLVAIDLPYPMRLAWDLNTKVKRISVHKLVAENFKAVFNDLLAHYGYEKIVELGIDLYGGTFNFRKMRGGTDWSKHSWYSFFEHIFAIRYSIAVSFFDCAY